MQHRSDLKRLAAAAFLVAVFAAISATSNKPQATQAYCTLSDNDHACVYATKHFDQGSSCDAGSCTTCVDHAGHCDPVGSGVDKEDWDPT
jgi:hypothetical protein